MVTVWRCCDNLGARASTGDVTGDVSGLELQAHGAPGISCLLLRASCLPGPWLPAEPVTFTNTVQLLRPADTSAPAQFFRLLRK